MSRREYSQHLFTPGTLLEESEALLADSVRLNRLPEEVVQSALYAANPAFVQDEKRAGIPQEVIRARHVSDLIIIGLCIYPAFRTEQQAQEISASEMVDNISELADTAVTRRFVYKQIDYLRQPKERWVAISRPAIRSVDEKDLAYYLTLSDKFSQETREEVSAFTLERLWGLEQIPEAS